MSLETYWLVVPLVGGTLAWGVAAVLWRLAQRQDKPHRAAE